MVNINPCCHPSWCKYQGFGFYDHTTFENHELSQRDSIALAKWGKSTFFQEAGQPGWKSFTLGKWRNEIVNNSQAKK